MKIASYIFTLLLFIILGACGGPNALTEIERTDQHDKTKSSKNLITIDWESLLPQGEGEALTQMYKEFYDQLELTMDPTNGVFLSGLEGVQEGSTLDTMPQLGTYNVVEDLNGARIRIPGFVVPLDMTKDGVSSFLVVPYFGACLHTPPPPPNQIIYATAEPAEDISNIYIPYWFEGVLKTNRHDTDLGNAAYTLQLEAVRPYT